jgi:Flp pilus assembly protein TadG
MQRLTRFGSADRGAAGVFVAISMTVLLGMVGLAVDVGAMYDERRQLSNGADAAVLAIAEDCALGVGSCDSATARHVAEGFASANARDGAAGVDSIELDPVARTVRVVTSTLTTDGTTTLAPFFAQVLGWKGTTVRASASAVWGHPSSMRNVLPLIISECEFPSGTSLPTPERVVYFHDGNNAEPCNAVAGQDSDGDDRLAGGFGWLATTHRCASDLSIGRWIGTDTGSSPSIGCDASDLAALLGEPTPLPIFNDITGVGNNGRYHIASFVLFVITGYNFGGQFKFNAPCHGDARCVSGYFVPGVVHDGDLGGPDRGIAIVKLTG